MAGGGVSLRGSAHTAVAIRFPFLPRLRAAWRVLIGKIPVPHVIASQSADWRGDGALPRAQARDLCAPSPFRGNPFSFTRIMPAPVHIRSKVWFSGDFLEASKRICTHDILEKAENLIRFELEQDPSDGSCVLCGELCVYPLEQEVTPPC